jgi:hypothetical protein
VLRSEGAVEELGTVAGGARVRPATVPTHR